MDDGERIAQLDRALDETKEQLYNTQTDLKYVRTENTALMDFISGLYRNCRELQDQESLSASEIIHNLIRNIEVFARDHRLDL